MTDVEVGALLHSPQATLLDRARSGDPEAFAMLIGPLDARAFTVAFAMLADAAEAEDAAQDANTRAWRHLRSVRDEARLPAWFLTIVGNECRRRLRSPWRRRVLLLALRPAGSAEATAGDSDHTVREALMQLGVDQRAVLILRHYFDLPLEEIAHELGVPIGTVKSRLSRASARIRDVLADMEFSP